MCLLLALNHMVGRESLGHSVLQPIRLGDGSLMQLLLVFGCLGNLREKEVLVSSIMIPQTRQDSWSELLTSNGGKEPACSVRCAAEAARTRSLSQGELHWLVSKAIRQAYEDCCRKPQRPYRLIGFADYLDRCALSVFKGIRNQLITLAVYFYVLGSAKAELLYSGTAFGRGPSARMSLESIRRCGNAAVRSERFLWRESYHLLSSVRIIKERRSSHRPSQST